MMTTKQALEILQNTPEDKFITESFFDIRNGKMCSHAILYFKENNIELSSENIKKLVCKLREDAKSDFYQQTTIFLFNNTKKQSHYIHGLSDVNNHKIGPYQQDTIKDRVVAFLKDMIAAGY